MKRRWIYIFTIAISVGMILFSFIPYGWKVWDNILISIGCSGITAAIMAIFLELYDEKKERSRKKQLRKIFFLGIEQELRQLFERVLWFDHVLDKIDLTKDIEYYLPLDFICEAHTVGYYRQATLDECEEEIELICNKYQMESLRNKDFETRSKIQKMFSIIGAASMPIMTELDNIKKNQYFLIMDNIFSSEELNEIYISIGRNVELLSTPDTAYGVALMFLLGAYKRIHRWGKYENEGMIISWKNHKNLVELVIEKRRKEAQYQKVEQQDEIENYEEKRIGIWQKVRKKLSFALKSATFIRLSRKNTD